MTSAQPALVSTVAAGPVGTPSMSLFCSRPVACMSPGAKGRDSPWGGTLLQPRQKGPGLQDVSLRCLPMQTWPRHGAPADAGLCVISPAGS